MTLQMGFEAASSVVPNYSSALNSLSLGADCGPTDLARERVVLAEAPELMRPCRELVKVMEQSFEQMRLEDVNKS